MIPTEPIGSIPRRPELIAPPALSLMYRPDGLLQDEHETAVLRCLARGAHKVQVDFIENAELVCERARQAGAILEERT